MCLVFREKKQNKKTTTKKMQNCNTLPYEMSCLLFSLHRQRLCLAFFFVVIGEKKYIYIYGTFLVTLALRHVKKLNHGRRKFAGHFRILNFHVQVMPGLCIRFSYSVFWNRKAVIRLVIFSFYLPWIDIVKKRKVICMLNDLTMLDSFSGSALFKTGLLHIWHSPLTSGFSILSYATKG